MKKNDYISRLLLILLLCVTGIEVYAYDIEAANADGVTIYYNYINDGTELEVARGTGYSGSVVIPESVVFEGNTYIVTNIGENAFYGYTGLTSVTLPNTVTNIGRAAFMECTELASINFPNSLTCIEGYAFWACNSLTSITFPSSVTRIEEYAFDCEGLQKVIVSDIVAWCGIFFENESSNPLFHAHYLYSDENTEITNLVIPDGVTSINCAFPGCRSITSVSIPNTVTTIGKRAFSGCTSLTSVIIPNSVTKIEFGAFAGCTGLTSVTIPNSVTSIGASAFNSCTHLTSVTIGNSVTSIGDYAFNYCSGLNSITIPNSLTDMGYAVFQGCSGLTKVVSEMENPCELRNLQIAGIPDVFGDYTYQNATLYIPQGTIDKYEAMDGWKRFEHIVEGIPTGVDHMSLNNNIQAHDGIISISGLGDSERIAIYQIDGKMVATAKAYNGGASVATNINKGTAFIVKIGDKAVKVMMK